MDEGKKGKGGRRRDGLKEQRKDQWWKVELRMMKRPKKRRD